MRRETLRGFAGLVAAAFLAVAQTPSHYVITTVAGAGKYAYPGDGRSATTVPLFEPGRVAFDREGNLYFTEGYYCRVFRVSTTGILTSVAGTGECSYGGDGGQATAAGFAAPAGIALDAAGNIYVGDRYRLRKISADGIVRTVAGTGVLGYSGDDGLASSAQLGTPNAITVDAANAVYFSNNTYHVVRRISPAGAITTVAGTGTAGYSGDGVPARSSRLNGPGGLATDAAGNLYIADSMNHRVRRVSPDGVITTVAGTGQPGYSGDNGPATSAQLDVPSGLAFDRSGHLFVATTTRGVVRRITPDGRIYTVGFAPVVDVAASPAGDLAVVDNARSLIHRMRADGTMTVMAGFVSGAALGDNGPATAAVLLSPLGIGLDGRGNLYLADYKDGRVRRVGADGVITTIAGTGGGEGNSGDNGLAKDAQLNQPNGLAVDPPGNVFVTCNTNIRRIDTGGIITSVVGTGELGDSGDGGPASRARIRFPRGLALDGAGNLYIADTENHRVRRVTRESVITTIAGNGVQGYSGNGVAATSAQLSRPFGVAVDTSGNVYIADSANHRVRKVSLEGIITDYAGDGQPGNTGDGGPATQARLNWPRSVAVDAAGNVFVASDTLVRRVSPNGVIITIAGSGDPLYSGDGGIATKAGMLPTCLVVDSAGRIYVSDPSNRRIRRLDPVYCTFAISPAGPLALPPEGTTSGKVGVTAGAGCQWTAASNARWISITLGGQGAGNGTVEYAVEENTTGAARSAVLTIAGLRLEVTQAASVRPSIAASGVVNGGSFLAPQGIAAATWVTLTGSNLAPTTYIWQDSDFVGGKLPTQLKGVSVTFNGKPGYVYYLSPSQINVLTPDGLAEGAVSVEVTTSLGRSSAVTVPKHPFSPAFFMFDPAQRKYVAAVHADGAYLGPESLFGTALVTSPAKPGEVILLFGTGFGPTSPPRPTGELVSAPAALSAPVSIRIGGQAAEVLWAGLVSSGLYQFNVKAPALSDGDHPVVAEIGGFQSQPNAFIAVRK